MAVRAPELHGEAWIGVDRLDLASLRGTVVLLDFWTLCCINCLRVAEELRGLERRFAGEVVVIGVHSPKFPHEHDLGAVQAAVARHRIEHPVLHDPALRTWDAYAVKAWPTLVLIDQVGRVALTVSGERQTVRLAAAIEELLAAGSAAPPPLSVPAPDTGELAFPGKVAVAPGRLAIADTGHDRVLVCDQGGTVLEIHDGLYQPQGVCFDGDDLVVCETGADRVWRIGADRRLITDGLASPWDVVSWRGHLVVAEAGRHRLVGIDADGEPQVLAGTTAEGLVDGPAHRAVLAQPSGLAVTPAGDLAFVDAESSALRILRAATLEVETLVGHGLFAWGAGDGDREHAALQHPLGVACGPDGALYVADTFNGLLRVFRGSHLWTVPLDGLREPGGVAVLPDGLVVVADTGAHRVVAVDPVADPPVAVAIPMTTAAEPLVAEVGATVDVCLDVDLDGEALDVAGGAPVHVVASASDPDLLPGETAWTLDALPARIALELGRGSGRVRMEMRAATCDATACRLRRTERTYDVILSP